MIYFHIDESVDDCKDEERKFEEWSVYNFDFFFCVLSIFFLSL